MKKLALLPIAILLLSFLCVSNEKQASNQNFTTQNFSQTANVKTQEETTTNQNLGMEEIDLSKFKYISFYQIKKIGNQYVLAGVNNSLEKDTVIAVYLENNEVKSYDEMGNNDYSIVAVVGIKEEDKTPIIYCSGFRNEDLKDMIIYFKGKEFKTIEVNNKSFFVMKDLENDIIPIVPTPEMGYCNVNTKECVLAKFGSYSISDGVVKVNNGNYYFFVTANDENMRYYLGFAKDGESEGAICKHGEGSIISDLYLQNAFVSNGKAIIIFNDPWLITTKFALFDISKKKFEKVIEVGNIYLYDTQFINDDDGYVIAGASDQKAYIIKFDKNLNLKWAREISFGTVGRQFIFEAKKEGDYYKIIGLYNNYGETSKLYFLTIGKDGSYNSGRVSSIDLSYGELDANNFKCEPITINYE